jgi:tetratricopeptide (TPR) repeat protein
MARFRLALVLTTALLASVAAIAWTVGVEQEADRLVSGARQRLDAPLREAPELDRIQASTAASMLERARELGRDSPELVGLMHYARAVEYLQRGDLLFAERELAVARQRLGWTADLHALWAEIGRRKTELDLAEERIERALALSPDHPRALVIAADIALDRRDPAAARTILERLIAAEPGIAALHERLAFALEELSELELAEASLREAIRLGPADGSAHRNLGRLLRLGGRTEDALAMFEQALLRDEDDADARLGRGLCLADLGRIEEAAIELGRAAELAPNDAEPMLALGDLRRDLGDARGAVELYREALSREEADAASWLKLGNALVVAGQPDLAVLAFREAIERAPDLAAAHNGLGAALMQAGEAGEAAEALERAAALDRADPNPLLNLALLHERAGDARAALTAFRDALARDPSSNTARESIRRLGG